VKRSRRAIPIARLIVIWRLYIEFRRPQVAPSTYRRDYGKITARLDRMAAAAPHLGQAPAIRDWLLAHYSAETTRRTMQQINAAITWAVASEIEQSNPFAGLSRGLRPKRPSDRAWAAFTTPERDRIIATFEDRKPTYAPWVQALFWTGARPEELAALRWEHCSPDCRELLICEALPIGQTQPQATKNYRSTRFPCNNRLARLLREQARRGRDRQAPIFPGGGGGRLHYQHFQRRHWRPLVLELVEQGAIAFCLSQYHARHTWITGALDAGMSVADISYLARVSTTVIYRHYAGRSRSILVPEF